MANQFVNLPSQAANGSGAGVDISTFGSSKTIVVAPGNWPAKNPTIIVEMNNDAAQGGTWAPVAVFQGAGSRVIANAAHWLRVTVSGFAGGDAPLVDVGGTDDGSQFAALVVPAAGVGPAVDISALGILKTLHIGNAFVGSIILELSEDVAGLDWGVFASFQAPGVQTGMAGAKFARLRRVGAPIAGAGAPIATIGGANPIGSTGGGTVIFNSVTTKDLAFTPAIMPAALAAGNTNDYNPAGLASSSRVRQATNAANSVLTGLASQNDGEVRIIENLGPGTLTFAAESAGSAAVNRFTLPSATDLVVAIGGTLIVIYDVASSRWRAIAEAKGASSTFSSVSTQSLAFTPSSTGGALPAGNTNNWTPASFQTTTRIRAPTNAAGSTVTGLLALSDGTVRIIENIGPVGNLTLTNEDAGSLAANRITLPGGLPLILPVGGTLMLVYDLGTARWRAIAQSLGSSPPVVTVSDLGLAPAITPAQLTGANNDYNPAGLAITTRIRQASDPVAQPNLTGLTAQADGKLRLFENIGTGTLTFNNENAGSAAANRFTMPGAADLVLASGGAAIFVYDAVTSRWLCIAIANPGTSTFQKITLTPAQSPAALAAGNTNDYNPAGLATTSRIRVTSNAAGSTLTGLTATNDGEIRILTNLGTGVLTLTNEDAGSLAVNRFTLPSGLAYTMPSGAAVILSYDIATTRWMVFGSGSQSLLGAVTPQQIYGDGSDGDVVISVNTTLARNMFYNNLTVNTGIVLSTANYHICVLGTLTLSGTAIISADGGAGGDGVAAAGGAAGVAAVFGLSGGGSNGAAGNHTGTGSPGVTTTATPRGFTQGTAAGGAINGVGGNGAPGQGGGGGGNNSAVGGTGGPCGANVLPASGDVHDIMIALFGWVGRSSAGGVFAGGSGGGSGAGDAAVPAQAGGGGAGGGWCVVRARQIVGTGQLTSKGGKGGNGAATGNVQGTGGAGGGSGGVLVVVINSGAFPTTSIAGGAGGTPGPIAQAGGTGGAGLLLKFTA